MSLLPDWPAWALNTFIGLAAFTAVVAVVQWKRDGGGKSDDVATIAGDKALPFRAFQRQYLIVYAIIMMADWFQGTNMYSLYSSYGVNISALFITGFLTGAVMASPVGWCIDKFGRKRLCIIYLVLEIIINIIEHVNNFGLLWFSRVLGGITTNILFTGFESWMQSEHKKRGFPQEWVADTVGKAGFINGQVAIIAGVLAQFAADAFGEIGPFKAAVALTALALVFVAPWPENYGGDDGGKDKKDDSAIAARAWELVKTDRKVFLIGTVYALFEGSMYSFVFMWVPTMMQALRGDPLPNGLVFASLMCCISLGGLLFSPSMLLSVLKVESLAVVCFFVGAAALTVPVFFNHIVPILGSFLVFETTVGIFNPCFAELRSRVIPDDVYGAVCNTFRIPLNSLVVLGTLLTDYFPARFVFGVIAVWMLIGAGLQYMVIQALQKPDERKKKKTK